MFRGELALVRRAILSANREEPYRNGPAKSRCNSRTFRRSCSTPIRSTRSRRMCWRCASNRKKGLSLRIVSRVPGTREQTHPVEMDFQYGEVFGRPSPEAYERLLLDVMAGDASRFMRRDAVEASWAWITRILEGWQQQGTRWLPEYPAGSPADRSKRIASFSRTAGPGDLCNRLSCSGSSCSENFLFRAEPADKPLELSSPIEGQCRQGSDFQLGRNLKVLLDVHFEHQERSTHLPDQAAPAAESTPGISPQPGFQNSTSTGTCECPTTLSKSRSVTSEIMTSFLPDRLPLASRTPGRTTSGPAGDSRPSSNAARRWNTAPPTGASRDRRSR